MRPTRHLKWTSAIMFAFTVSAPCAREGAKGAHEAPASATGGVEVADVLVLMRSAAKAGEAMPPFQFQYSIEYKDRRPQRDFDLGASRLTLGSCVGSPSRMASEGRTLLFAADGSVASDSFLQTHDEAGLFVYREGPLGESHYERERLLPIANRWTEGPYDSSNALAAREARHPGFLHRAYGIGEYARITIPIIEDYNRAGAVVAREEDANYVLDMYGSAGKKVLIRRYVIDKEYGVLTSVVAFSSEGPAVRNTFSYRSDDQWPYPIPVSYTEEVISILPDGSEQIDRKTTTTIRDFRFTESADMNTSTGESFGFLSTQAEVVYYQGEAPAQVRRLSDLLD